MIANVLMGLVALLHVTILVLEMFLWETPRAALLLGGSQSVPGRAVALFFLGCVVVAGVYGAATASRKIIFVQALPGAVAMAAVLLG